MSALLISVLIGCFIGIGGTNWWIKNHPTTQPPPAVQKDEVILAEAIRVSDGIYELKIPKFKVKIVPPPSDTKPETDKRGTSKSKNATDDHTSPNPQKEE